MLRPDASVEMVRVVTSGMGRAVEAAGAIPPVEREPGSMKIKVVKTVREAAT